MPGMSELEEYANSISHDSEALIQSLCLGGWSSGGIWKFMCVCVCSLGFLQDGKELP